MIKIGKDNYKESGKILYACIVSAKIKDYENMSISDLIESLKLKKNTSYHLLTQQKHISIATYIAFKLYIKNEQNKKGEN